MAITPRSILKNPTLLLAAVISGLMAMAGAALFFSAFFCTGYVQQPPPPPVDRLAELRTPDCDHLIAHNGDNLGTWSHDDFVTLSACFERATDYRRAATSAAWGIGFYPTSEQLHNIRGYNLIVLEDYDAAVIALRVGLQSVKPTNGTLQNNLAWAGLYANKHMALSEARDHYRDALDVEPNSCETLHTGMWVEYGIASRSNGTSRDTALTAFRHLRNKYEPCKARIKYGDKLTRFEVAGAAVLDSEVQKLSMVQAFEKNRLEQPRTRIHQSNVVANAVGPLNLSYSDVDEACEDIAPIASARPACRKLVKSALCKMKRR